MLNAEMMSAVVRNNRQDVKRYAAQFAQLAKQLHTTEYDGDKLPSLKDEYRKAFSQIADKFTDDEAKALYRLIDSIPERKTFIHGDLHMGNVMLQDGEPMLIDLGESGIGHPIFDIAEMLIAYVFAPKSPYMTPERLLATVGMEAKLCEEVWNEFIRCYYNDCDDAEIRRRIGIISGYTQLRLLLITVMMRRSVSEGYWGKKVHEVRERLLPRVEELISGLDF